MSAMLLSATAALPAVAAPDPASSALARAIERRDRRDADLDGALSLFVRGARAHDEPIERMLVRLKQLLRAHVHPLRADDDPHEVVALVMRRAITAYYRD
jgi:hypothetical protein